MNVPHGSSSQGVESLRDGDAAAVAAAAVAVADRRALPEGEKPRRWGETNGTPMGPARAVAVGDGGRGGGHRAN